MTTSPATRAAVLISNLPPRAAQILLDILKLQDAFVPSSLVRNHDALLRKPPGTSSTLVMSIFSLSNSHPIGSSLLHSYCTPCNLLIYNGAGEGNRTLVTGIVVYSGVECLDFAGHLRICAVSLLHKLHSAYGIHLQKTKLAVLVYSIH